jgi:hypothetical protein
VTNNFRIGLPEAAGLAIVGSTLGALLGGAAEGHLDLFGVVCAIAGAVVPFGVVLVPRLRRTDDHIERG